MSRHNIRKLNARRTRWMLRTRRRDRRGVLLMVVLSMLALFLLLGTAFLVSSRFYATTSKESAKGSRTTNNPADLMERAMLQVLRDTNNPSSSIRYHSLLRDVYGSDGFAAQVYGANNISEFYALPEYSGASRSNPANPLGHTNGQFLDIYVADQALQSGKLPDTPTVIKLDRSADGMTVDHSLPPSKGYYNGCLLTMLSGPAAGQTTRIIDYQLMPQASNPNPVFRIRVMAFGTADGNPIAPADLERVLAGHNFMVNGRANSGTGAGYNRLAQRGGAKLNAVELMATQGGLVGTEIALTPNSRFIDVTNAASFPSRPDPTLGTDPFRVTGLTPAEFNLLNPNRDTLLYPTADGPGGSNESYDAVDFQNMFLAHMPVAPRATASLIDANGVMVELGDAAGVQTMLGNTSVAMRLDMENTIVPSFHQPALINYWYQRLHDAPWLVNAMGNENQRAQTIIAPYGTDGQSNIGNPINDQIVAIKRKISLRPIPEDHPNFDGGNPSSRYAGTASQSVYSVNGDIRFPAWEVVGPWDVDNDNDGINDSVWVDLGDPVQETENGTLYKPLYAFLIVDLDNRLNVNAHGSPDHFAVTQLDLMLAATGNIGNLAGTASSNLLPHGMGWGPGDVNLRSILSPLTQPYSPAFISNYGDPRVAPGSQVYDDYARLFFGRLMADPGSDAIWGRMGNSVTSGTYGPGKNFNGTTQALINGTREPNLAFEFVGYPVVDRVRAEQVYAATGDTNIVPYLAPSAFATTPDLRGRYAVGVDYTGQPVYESSYDGFIQAPLQTYLNRPLVTLVDESPYETYLPKDGRRGVPDQAVVHNDLRNGVAVNDDAPFATSELERLLRRYDPEAGTAPSRLFDIVDAFDPVKYATTIASNSDVITVPDPTKITAAEMAYAQTVTATNSRQVTTDSYEIPTPSDVVPSYITELGPDGAPGLVGVDDDENGVTDDPSEVGWHEEQNPNDPTEGLYLAAWSDDFEAYTGKSVAEARLVDVMWYRIQRARERRGQPIYNWHNPQAVAIMNNICEQLLPPEVLAGYKMDINRPFGDGRDNNGNGIVDEPVEAGEPWLDKNGNGVWERDNDEPFIDLDGDGRFYADANGDGEWDPTDPSDYVNVNGVAEPLVDNLWAAQLGGTPALLNSTMGKDVTGRLVTPNGVLHDDAHLARQLYARHLYVLMLVLMDEDYLAPYDPADPSVRGYLRVKSILLKNGGMPDYDAKVEAHRRYTCRQIAQWAVNCVDFRDSDSINTPFEYDENPWDGWGTVNEATSTQYPLDGDPATDENHGQYIDWANMGTTGEKVVVNAAPTIGTGGNQLPDINATRALVWGAERPELLISEAAAFHDLRQEDRKTSAQTGDNTTAPSQDPNVPEDDDLDQRLEPRGSLYVEVYNPNSGDAPKPVELYRHGNWDRDGNGTIDDADRFHWIDMNNNNRYDQGTDQIVEGVLLDRLSDRVQIGPDGKARRSPVWRIIVVEEHPGYHASEGVLGTAVDPDPVTRDDATSHGGNLQIGLGAHLPPPNNDYAKAVNGIQQITDRPWLAPMNMDWDDMYFIPPWWTPDFTQATKPWKMSTWQQRRTDSVEVNAQNPQNQPSQFMRALFSKPYPYIEREFYFTSGNTKFFTHSRSLATGISDTNVLSTQRSYTDLEKGVWLRDTYFRNLNIRIPFNYIDLGTPTYGNGDVGRDLVSMPFRFVSSRIAQNHVVGTGQDVQIAPIMPGRYGVIGSAGTVYGTPALRSTADGLPARTRFITTLGRNVEPAGGEADPKYGTKDDSHVDAIMGTRRIELQPSPNPFVQQVVVGANGGIPTGGNASRGNELMEINGSTVNMTAKRGNSQMDAASEVLAPVVAIPVDDMNVSEPAYGYGVRARELFQLEAGSGDEDQTWRPDGARGEGAFGNTSENGGLTDAHFDTPFDVDPEFDGAEEHPKYLPKYRVVHLQRLADPTMPWNPPPGYNTADPQKLIFGYHDYRLPVNPYLTVDSAAVDLTVFNGTSSSQINQAGPPQLTKFKSRERGGTLLRSQTAFPQRWNWNQDTFLAGAKPDQEVGTLAEIGFPASIRTAHFVSVNHFDFFLRHSLGLPNESLGSVYLRPETNLPDNMIDPTDLDSSLATSGPALGAPRPDGNLTSTTPWMTWNNRPFVSESELLQVPGWSSMELLRKFSGLDPNRAVDPYVNEGGKNASNVDVTGAQIESFATTGAPNISLDAERTNAARYKVHTAGFGALVNMVESSQYPARIMQDSSGNPVPVGAANFHRILDYVHTPSRFVATDTLLNPVAFSAATITSPDDPRWGKAAPFNRMPDYREPGKVNLNTIVSQRGPTPDGLTVWSDVFDGLMHRVRDGDPSSFPNGSGLGHMGPAWRDIVLSRRGYGDPVNVTAGQSDRVDLVLDNTVPTFFSNPFRSSEAGDLVPLEAMTQKGAEASMLRAHPFQPSGNAMWATPGGGPLLGNSRMAGLGDGTAFQKVSNKASVPLFSELTFVPGVDAPRNSAMHYMPLTRIDNLTTTRSGVFAVWVTVGYFEVLPAPEFSGDVQRKFQNQTGDTTPEALRARALYNKVYPQGYQLGKELKSETGDIDRHRSFYIIDRTRPVAFKPGEDVNVEDAILLRRRID